MKSIKSLIQKGFLSERGYYPTYKDEEISPLTGFVMLRSPDDGDQIARLERELDMFRALGTWYLMSGKSADYIFLLTVSNSHPSLKDFFSSIRSIIGSKSETHFIIPKD